MDGGEFDESVGFGGGEVFDDESGKWRLLWRFLQVEMDDWALFVSRGSFVVSCLRAEEQLDKWFCSTGPAAARALYNLCSREPGYFVKSCKWISSLIHLGRGLRQVNKLGIGSNGTSLCCFVLSLKYKWAELKAFYLNFVKFVWLLTNTVRIDNKFDLVSQ